MRKQGESFFKGLKYTRTNISAISPKQYADRFVQFMVDHSK